MNPAERLVLVITQLIVSNRIARWIFIGYLTSLHLLIFSSMYFLALNGDDATAVTTLEKDWYPIYIYNQYELNANIIKTNLHWTETRLFKPSIYTIFMKPMSTRKPFYDIPHFILTYTNTALAFFSQNCPWWQSCNLWFFSPFWLNISNPFTQVYQCLDITYKTYFITIIKCVTSWSNWKRLIP